MIYVEWAFLLLLVTLNVCIRLHPTALMLFTSAMLVSTAACGLLVFSSFFPQPGQKTLPPTLKAIFVTLALSFNFMALASLYERLNESRHPVLSLHNEPMPDVTITTFDGNRHTLGEFKGHVMVLHFWATWCVPCRKEFPMLLGFARAHPEVTFLAVDVNDDRKKADGFITETERKNGGKGPANLLYMSDADSAFSYDLFAIHTYPSSIFVDKKGRMREKFAVPVEWNGPGTLHYLESVEAVN